MIILFLLAFICIIGIILASRLIMVREGKVVVFDYLGKPCRIAKAGSLCCPFPFLENAHKISWTRMSYDSSLADGGGAVKTKYEGYSIPISPIIHDVPPYKVASQDQTDVTIDMRFNSLVFDPMLAVSGNTPTDLWSYVDAVFQSTICDLVRNIHTKDLTRSHSWTRFCGELMEHANVNILKYGIRIEDARIQSVRLPEALYKSKEALSAVATQMDVAEKELDMFLLKVKKLTEAGLTMDQILRLEMTHAIGRSQSNHIHLPQSFTNSVVVESRAKSE